MTISRIGKESKTSKISYEEENFSTLTQRSHDIGAIVHLGTKNYWLPFYSRVTKQHLSVSAPVSFSIPDSLCRSTGSNAASASVATYPFVVQRVVKFSFEVTRPSICPYV
ncbi:hypothetical protein V1477_010837 [Vespula maculifrons]|uniref:Uncharacterized protein n=1 Tax=Vespula maculifrons TaxID=7453 RepID=A0ABD2C331_VESMC